MQAETSHIDELLECLVFLTRFYGVPNSQEALTTGLPLVSGRLSTALFSRAAERGGLSAREVIQPLENISPLLLPCVLQTRHGGACILLVIIALPIWHGMHRIYHGLHDLGIHTTKLHHYVFYGFAFLVSAITVGLLMVLVLQ